MKKDDRIKKEIKRLKDIFKDMPEDTKTLYDGLIHRAAYMRVTLEDYEADLDDKGYVEMFSQSKDVPGYERKRPVAELYNAMIKNYQTAMKQLMDKIPETEMNNEAEDMLSKYVAK